MKIHQSITNKTYKKVKNIKNAVSLHKMDLGTYTLAYFIENNS